MGLGPPLQAINTGDPVTADRVYGNDEALQRFGRSHPNDNLEKPRAAYVVNMCGAGAYSNNTTHYGAACIGNPISDTTAEIKRVTLWVECAASIAGAGTIDVSIERDTDSAWGSPVSVHSFTQLVAGTSAAGGARNGKVGYFVNQTISQNIDASDNLRFKVVINASGPNVEQVHVSVAAFARHQV